MPFKYHAEMIQEVRNRIDEPTAQSISNRFISRLLNQGQVVVGRDLYVMNDTGSLATVVNQQEYDFPDGYVNFTNVIYQFATEHRTLNQIGLEELLAPDPEYGDPEVYAVDYANRKLYLFPIPNGNAQTSTLVGNITVADTTINVASTSNFGASGRIMIDAEIVQYTGITSTTITGCVRGADGTVAAAHTNGTTVQWRNVSIYFARLPRTLMPTYQGITPVLASYTQGATTISAVSGTPFTAANNVIPGSYIGFGSYDINSASELFPIRWYKITTVTSNTIIQVATPIIEATSIIAPFIITDASELLESECMIPILYALIFIFERMGAADKRTAAASNLENELYLAKARMIGPNYLPSVKRSVDSQDIPPMYLRGPAYYPPFKL